MRFPVTRPHSDLQQKESTGGWLITSVCSRYQGESNEVLGQNATYTCRFGDAEPTAAVFYSHQALSCIAPSASMVGDSWLGQHFRIVGDRSEHFGLFDCSGPPPAAEEEGGSSGSACAGGACC